MTHKQVAASINLHTQQPTTPNPQGLTKETALPPVLPLALTERGGGLCRPWPRPGYSPVAPPVAAAAVVWYPSAALSGGQPVSEGSTDQQVAAEASASLFPRVTPAILAMLVPSAQTTRREVEIAVSAALPLMRKGSEWAGLGREGADLRRALQAYGEGQYRGWVTFFPPSFVTTAMAEGWRVLAGRSSPRKDAGSEEARASQDPGRGRRKVKATFVGGEDSIRWCERSHNAIHHLAIQCRKRQYKYIYSLAIEKCTKRACIIP